MFSQMSRSFMRCFTSKSTDAANSSDVVYATSFGSSGAKSELARQRLLRLLLVVYVSFMVLIETCIIMPALYSDRWHVYSTYFVFGLYLLIGFVSSAVRIVLVDPSIKGLMLVNKAGRDWTYCLACQSVRPPRAHHCHVCATCVLRRDHHCVILAQCIGLSNWRFFLTLLLYGAMGGFLASWFNLQFVFGDQFLTTDWSTGFRVLCILAPPGLLWITRQISLWQTAIFMLTTSSLLFACSLACFFCLYVHLMLRNQTMSDQMARSKALAVDPQLRTPEVQMIVANTHAGLFNVGPRANVYQFLGQSWLKALLIPLSNSPLTTDGLSFPRSDGVKFQ
ncbi:Palmitoyltransferase [Paragonimus heterotremus]|uniref:Palmitoyltransferase n=1 Tax=Paragonimus heterotremus TaxID=100268 RepID=A0A8J4SF87_9TREM|nr:Palmitoyltransferase [Paragonimus heterotremus]